MAVLSDGGTPLAMTPDMTETQKDRLLRLDRHLQLRADAARSAGVQPTSIETLLASIRPAWHGDVAALAAVDSLWAQVSSCPEGRESLATVFASGR